MIQTSILSLGVMMVLGISVFLGMNAFMEDLSRSYDIESFTDSDDTAAELLDNIEQNTTIDLQKTLTGEQGWVKTTLNIFFRFPATVVGSLATMANAAAKITGLAIGEEGYIATPPWVPTMIATLIGIVVVSTLIYIVIGRKA